MADMADMNQDAPPEIETNPEGDPVDGGGEGEPAEGEAGEESPEDELLKCPICMDAFKEPKMLPCVHTFCQPCLEEYVDGDKATSGKFPCPLCQNETVIPDDGVAGLPGNVFIDILQSIRAAQNDAERKCDNCEDGDQGEAWCCHCTWFLCETCHKAHKRVALSKHHHVLMWDEMQKEKAADIILMIPDYCSHHQMEQLMFYCITHNYSICRDCRIKNHIECKVDEINDSAELQRTALKGVAGNVTDLQVPQLEEALEHIKEDEEEFENCKNQTLAAIKEQADHIHKLVNDWCDALVDETNNTYNKEQGRLTVSKTNLETMIKATKNTLAFTELLLQKGSDAHVLSIKGNLGDQLRTLEDQKMAAPVPRLKITFTEGTIRPDASESLFGLIKSEREYSQVAEPKMLLNFPFKNLFENILNNSNWENRENGGMCITSNGDVVIAEQQSSKIKVFDKEGKKIDEIPFGKSRPCQVAEMKDKSWVITDDKANDVKIYTNNEKEKSLKRFVEKIKQPRGVAVNGRGDVIVVSEEDAKIYVYDKDGTLINTIKETEPGEPFKRPRHVTVNVNKNIIVSDVETCSITAFSQSWDFLWKYGSKGNGIGEMNGPEGMCCDRNGYVVVADRNNNRLHLLTAEGEFRCFLLNKGGEEGALDPYAVAVDNERRLILSQGGGIIKVFDFSTN